MSSGIPATPLPMHGAEYKPWVVRDIVHPLLHMQCISNNSRHVIFHPAPLTSYAMITSISSTWCCGAHVFASALPDYQKDTYLRFHINAMCVHLNDPEVIHFDTGGPSWSLPRLGPESDQGRRQAGQGSRHTLYAPARNRQPQKDILRSKFTLDGFLEGSCSTSCRSIGHKCPSMSQLAPLPFREHFPVAIIFYRSRYIYTLKSSLIKKGTVSHIT